jgi:hypothetical protein
MDSIKFTHVRCKDRRDNDCITVGKRYEVIGITTFIYDDSYFTIINDGGYEEEYPDYLFDIIEDDSDEEECDCNNNCCFCDCEDESVEYDEPIKDDIVSENNQLREHLQLSDEITKIISREVREFHYELIELLSHNSDVNSLSAIGKIAKFDKDTLLNY